MKKILLRRGLSADLPTLDIGEPGFVTDTGELYIGSTSGNVLINTINGSGGLTEQQLNDAISAALTGYATESYVNNQISMIPPPNLTGYATETYVNDAIGDIESPVSVDSNNNITLTTENTFIDDNEEEITVTKQWEFASDGTTYLSKNSFESTTYLSTPLNETDVSLEITAGRDIYLKTAGYDSEGGVSTSIAFKFDDEGALTFPDGTVQTTAYTGDINGDVNLTGYATTEYVDNKVSTKFEQDGWKIEEVSGLSTITIPPSTINNFEVEILQVDQVESGKKIIVVEFNQGIIDSLDASNDFIEYTRSLSVNQNLISGVSVSLVSNSSENGSWTGLGMYVGDPSSITYNGNIYNFENTENQGILYYTDNSTFIIIFVNTNNEYTVGNTLYFRRFQGPDAQMWWNGSAYANLRDFEIKAMISLEQEVELFNNYSTKYLSTTFTNLGLGYSSNPGDIFQAISFTNKDGNNLLDSYVYSNFQYPGSDYEFVNNGTTIKVLWTAKLFYGPTTW